MLEEKLLITYLNNFKLTFNQVAFQKEATVDYPKGQ